MIPRRPVHHLRQFHYNDRTGVMEGDRINVEGYQQWPDQPPAASPPQAPPINISVNLGEILSGLGLKEMVSEILSLAMSQKVNESQSPALPTMTRGRLIEAVARGADAGEVLDLMAHLEGLGCIE